MCALGGRDQRRVHCEVTKGTVVDSVEARRFCMSDKDQYKY